MLHRRGASCTLLAMIFSRVSPLLLGGLSLVFGGCDFLNKSDAADSGAAVAPAIAPAATPAPTVATTPIETAAPLGASPTPGAPKVAVKGDGGAAPAVGAADGGALAVPTLPAIPPMPTTLPSGFPTAIPSTLPPMPTSLPPLPSSLPTAWPPPQH